jgi:hypothetical protein
MTTLIVSKARILQLEYIDFISYERNLESKNLNRDISFLQDLQKGLRSALSTIAVELRNTYELDINDISGKTTLLDFEEIQFFMKKSDRPVSIDCNSFIISFFTSKGWNINDEDFTYFYLHKALQSYKTKIETEINIILNYIRANHTPVNPLPTKKLLTPEEQTASLVEKYSGSIEQTQGVSLT